MRTASGKGPRRERRAVASGLALVALIGVAWWLVAREGGDGERPPPAARATAGPAAAVEGAALPSATSATAPAHDLATSPLVEREGAHVSERAKLAASGSQPHLVGLVIHGRVVHTSGAPAGGAVVRLLPDHDTLKLLGLSIAFREADPPQIASAVTAHDGRFTLETRVMDPATRAKSWPIPAKDPSLFVFAEGMAIHGFPCPIVDESEIDVGVLVLDQPECVLEARIADERGAPVAGARAAIMRTQGYPEGAGDHPARRLGYLSFVAGESGGDGRIRLEGLWPMRFTLSLLHDSYQLERVSDIEVVEGTTDLGTIVMRTGRVLGGVVVDAEGRPVAGAEVYALDAALPARIEAEELQPGHWETYDVSAAVLDARRKYGRSPSRLSPARTDEEGRFLKSGLEGERFDVLVDASGYEVGHLLEVAAGTTDVEVVVQREAVLRLRIVGAATAQPLGGATVRAWRQTGMRDRSERPLRTEVEVVPDASEPGAFDVRRVGRRGTEVLAGAPGHETRSFDLEGLEAPGEREEILALGPAARLAGRVLDDAGLLVPDATVMLVPNAAHAEKCETVSEGDGSYAFEGLTAGEWELSATRRGFHGSAPMTVVIEPGLGVAETDIVLQPAGAVVGVVLRTGGAPAAGVEVGAWWLGSRTPELARTPGVASVSGGVAPTHFVSSTRTDSAGRFDLMGLPAVSMTIKAEPGVSMPIELQPGEIRELTLALRGLPLVRGRVTAGGAPVAGATVAAVYHRPIEDRDASGALVRIVTFDRDVPGVRANEFGEYALELPAEGQHTLRAYAEGGGDAPRVTLLARWDTTEVVDFELGTGAVRGSVTDRDGRVPAGLEARLLREGEKVTEWRPLAGDGRFAFEPLRPGAYEVQARGAGFARSSSGLVSVGPEQRRDDVNVVLVVGARIEGVVVGSDGRPTGARIYRHGPGDDDDGEVSSLGTTDGRFELTGLMPGRHRIVAGSWIYGEALRDPVSYGPPQADASLEVLLEPGETRRIELVVPRTGP